jgi:hypothetical protein
MTSNMTTTRYAVVLYYDDEKEAEDMAVAVGCMMIDAPPHERPAFHAPVAIALGLPKEGTP